MSVTLKAPDGTDLDLSNGEWAALTAMKAGFSELPEPWTGDHGCKREWTPAELRALAFRAEQVGRTAQWLRELAEAGGAKLS